jgi:glutathione S-transferase
MLMVEDPIELHQFSHSHFNEKVRWTLDYKGIPHVRINYIPGPHVAQIRRLSGQAQVPVVRIDGRVVHGSAAIIDVIEQRFPSPPLYPADATTREEALALQARLDAELGPEVRRAAFETIIDDAAFMVATFASEKPAWKRRAFRAAFPLVRAVMKKSMNITPETGRRARDTVDKMLDFLAEKSAATGYLAGDAFSVADLTGAALLGPVALVDHPDMRQAEPRPPRYAALCAEWGAHPGMRWAHEIWRKHRPPRGGIVIA